MTQGASLQPPPTASLKTLAEKRLVQHWAKPSVGDTPPSASHVAYAPNAREATSLLEWTPVKMTPPEEQTPLSRAFLMDMSLLEATPPSPRGHQGKRGLTRTGENSGSCVLLSHPLPMLQGIRTWVARGYRAWKAQYPDLAVPLALIHASQYPEHGPTEWHFLRPLFAFRDAPLAVPPTVKKPQVLGQVGKLPF